MRKSMTNAKSPAVSSQRSATPSNIPMVATASAIALQRLQQRAGDSAQSLAAAALQRKADAALQRMDDEELQGKFADSVQRMEEEELQGKFAAPVQRETASSTQGGLPGNLQTGIESLSGHDMSDVQVHYNSSKPAEVGALAYTQGSSIHVGPGQEQHLPHEAWHTVQQRQGRVQPTGTVAGLPLNDDAGLEHEADVMGARAESEGVRQNRLIQEKEG